MEYGLCLAKMVLDKIKKLDESRIMMNDEVSFMIKWGDDLFLESSFQERQEENQVDTLTPLCRYCSSFSMIPPKWILERKNKRRWSWKNMTMTLWIG